MLGREIPTGRFLAALGTSGLGAVASLFSPWNASADELAPSLKPPQLVLEQPAISDFTKQQCVTILDKASYVFSVVGRYGYNPELPLTFARYMAPNDAEFVQGFLLDHAAFERIANSKRAEDLPTQRHLVATLTCNGNKRIVVSGREGVALWVTIRTTLIREAGISLERAGLRGVQLEVVGSLSSPAAPKLLEAPRQDGKLRLN